MKQCAICHLAFNCGVNHSKTPCWCAAFPPIMPISSQQNCLCPTCLSRATAKKIQLLIRSNSLTQLLKIARPYFNPNQLIEYVDYTLEHGNTVFSAWYHLKRGTCCHHGCRHCPYRKEKNQ